MANEFAVLKQIENNQPITKASNYEFLHLLQTGLLLALKEQGQLDEMQYRQAQEKLNRQRQEWTRKSGKRND